MACSFSDDICTPLIANPDLVRHPGSNIDSVPNPICFFFGILLFRVRYCQLSFEDQMRGSASVRVRIVVGVPVAKLLAQGSVCC